jgi:AIPR protein
MQIEKRSFWPAYVNNNDFKNFGNNGLLLFALKLKFNIEDIVSAGIDSITDGPDDKKADLVYLDTELGFAVIIQGYFASQDKAEDPSNKASDLNTALTWLLNKPIDQAPERLKTHAEALRRAFKDNEIKNLHIWYVHNLVESDNIKRELDAVELTAFNAISRNFPEYEIEIHSKEVGQNTLEEWYNAISTPILINDNFEIPIEGGYCTEGSDWSSYVTALPIKWFYDKFKEYGAVKLFSANIRDYLGSRQTDDNINNGIKRTALDDPAHFWVFNNGITALVHNFKEVQENRKLKITFEGISIINGAQTSGAVGHLMQVPDDLAKVQVRFIKCTNPDTLYSIVKYNNSQNRIIAPDFRSKEPVQIRLKNEFEKIPNVEYIPRRGGHEDIIKRPVNALYSITAGQALAAFHGTPQIAYHGKTKIWEDNEIYTKYFNEQTKAEHIVFAHSLQVAIETKKIQLKQKSKDQSLLEVEIPPYLII